MNARKEQMLSELNRENMLETIRHFSHLFRYSGTPEGEQAVSYIEKKLDTYGVSYEHCEYDGFFSLPVHAELLAAGKRYSLIGDVYSAEAHDLTGELLYDFMSEKKERTGLEEEKRFASFKDKLVLTWEGRGSFARKALQAGARGIIHINNADEHYIHHSNIGTIWGTPGLDEEPYMHFLPSAGISRADGKTLIEALSQGFSPLTASLTVGMDTQIRKSSMVIAEIPGASENFLLLSGHYDSWYEGITDNAVSDAILLEYARIFQEHRHELTRGIKIAWWSGHSDGRFSGSTWYFDSHWADLHDHCVAHINLDLTGCKNSDQIVTRTAGTEGLSYTGKLIEKYTGRTPEAYIPMIRGADQSFWGACIPITIMLKYEPVPENRLSNCPSGGPWWHTSEDTIDKLDEVIMMRDARINLELTDDIQSAPVLPVNIPVFMADMGGRLNTVLRGLPEDFPVSEIRSLWDLLNQELAWLSARADAGDCPDSALKATIGRLLHLIYCRRDLYSHDFGDGFGIFGAFERFRGMTRDNSSKKQYAMAKTEFLRNRNRLCGGMQEIIETIRHMRQE